MKVGVNFPASPFTVDPATFARKAESLGFESMWAGEHPIIPLRIEGSYPQLVDGDVPEFYAHVADPLISLAHAAAATRELRLGTGVCLVTERNPLLLAKELATLDHYSGGRVVLGAGAGWLREELEILGVDFETRWQRLEESVAALRALWGPDPAEFHGGLIDFPPVRCSPKPARPQGIPVLAGIAGRRGIEAAAAWGDGWYPVASSPDALRADLAELTRACERVGRDVAQLDVTLLLGVNAHTPIAEQLRAYADAGATRVVLAAGAEEGVQATRDLQPFGPGQADAALEDLARRAKLG